MGDSPVFYGLRFGLAAADPDSVSQPVVIVEGVEKWQELSEQTSDRGSHTSEGGDLPARRSEITSVQFARIARQLNEVALSHDLRAPAFRSPPRAPGLCRSIKRRADGSATVSVSLRGRPAVAVVADMIDGVMAANEPGSTRSAVVRDRLWLAATPFLEAAEPEPTHLTARRAA